MFLVSVLWPLMTFASVCVQTSPGVESPPFQQSDIEKHISHLADARFQIRNKALQSLEVMGPAILPNLRTALSAAKDPEVRRQLESLIPKLEVEIALEPTRFSLDLKNITLSKAAEEISRISGYKVELLRNGNNDPDQQLITVVGTNLTFWQAVDKLCEACGYTIQDYYGADVRKVQLTPGDHYPGTLCMSGAFRVMVRHLNSNRTLDLNSGRNGVVPGLHRTSYMTITLSLCAEPRLVLLGAGPAMVTDAEDDQGQSLRLPPVNAAHRSYHNYRSHIQSVQANLEPSANGRRLRMFKGTIPVTVVAAQRPLIVVDKLATIKNQTYKEGTTTLQIDSVTFENNQTQIKMTISENNRANNRDYSWTQNILQRLEVTDEKGNKLQSFGGNWNGGLNSVSGTFSFGLNGNGSKGVKLVMYEWTTSTHHVPFEFENLPLP